MSGDWFHCLQQSWEVVVYLGFNSLLLCYTNFFFSSSVSLLAPLQLQQLLSQLQLPFASSNIPDRTLDFVVSVISSFMSRSWSRSWTLPEMPCPGEVISHHIIFLF